METLVALHSRNSVTNLSDTVPTQEEMKKVYHLGKCSTCQRILTELTWQGEQQEIRSEKITPEKIDEMAQLQGFKPDEFAWQSAGLEESAAGAALGNGQTVSVVKALLPHVLFHGSVITYAQFLQMKAAC